LSQDFFKQRNSPILLGLLGQSLGHSLSPLIHQSFFDELGLAGRYEKIEVPEASLVPERLLALAAEGYSGLNVTIPYKLTVMSSLTELDEGADLAGAVNTIKIDFGSLTGYNTDVGGLAEALALLEFAGASSLTPSQTPLKAIILGAGGAARAAVIAASRLGFRQLVILSRQEDAGRTMLNKLAEGSDKVSLVSSCQKAICATFCDAPGQAKITDQVHLIINATPIGQKDDHVPPEIIALMRQVSAGYNNAVFVDLVYARQMTPLCRVATEEGFARVEDGKEMLINQARLAFKIWTGHLPGGQLARERLN